jgi:hypothetical protein
MAAHKFYVKVVMSFSHKSILSSPTNESANRRIVRRGGAVVKVEPETWGA